MKNYFAGITDSSDSSDEEALLLIGIVVASEKEKRQQNMWVRGTHQVSFLHFRHRRLSRMIHSLFCERNAYSCNG